MKGVVRVGKWRPIVGVCCLGMAFAGLSLQLEGALPRSSNDGAAVTAVTHTVPVSNEALWARAGQIPAEGLPIFPAQIVDPFDDEPSRLRAAGLLKGALPLPSDNVIAGACTFDIECEDGNPCTADVCNITIANGAGSGTCSNPQLPTGAEGECSDGLFCNGIETCNAGGACVDGPDPTCCTDPEEYCTENLGSCVDGDTPGRRCSTDADCGSGTCEHCREVCSIDADCDDGLACNGAETCSGGECLAGNSPCGAGATCSENRCIGQAPARGCNTEEDCNPGIPCNNSQGPLCYVGRCCSNAVEPACTNRRLNQPPGTTCQSSGGKFFPGDAGLESGAQGTCGGVNPREPGTSFGCPKYSSGLEQLNVNSPPTYPVAVGPMSASGASIPAPNGPGGALNRIGDDYTLTNTSHIRLTAIRLVGFMSVPDAIFIEFWDNSGNLIEDLLFRPSTGVGVNVVILEQPIVIPHAGRIAAVNKREFGLNSKFIWMSATGATTGTNGANVLFVNNDPNAANFMAPDPGVLAFELLGAKVAAPTGGCCMGDGSCTNELEWICDQLGGGFQGVGNFCNTCVNGDNAGASCGICVGGGTPGAPCAGSNECSGGSCAANDAVCNAGADTCSNNGEDICTVDGDCPALPNVCSNSPDNCVLNSDCPAGGTCGGAGTCESGVCAALAACGVGACCDTTTGDCALTTSGSCSGSFQGLGTTCEPNCCLQPATDTDCSDGICYTGADNCADAFVHMIPALPCATCGPGGTPADEYIVTITGNNAFASATTDNPDSCWGVADAVDVDQGWWEAFSLAGDCTRVRFDFCCTTPTNFGDWAFLAQDCGCNTGFLNNKADPYLDLQFSANRGAPFCNEDNLWTIMGLMQAGTYYIPVNSTLEDELGSYQLHIVAEACPTAACCLPNGSCIDGVNVFECENEPNNGTFLAQPNRFPSVALCTPGICDTGSCCTGPGQCADEVLGDPIEEEECVGAFVGGLKCEGGVCDSNPLLSCDGPEDCGSGGCSGDARSLAQPNPCPVCQFESSANCQLYDNPAAFNYSIAELSIGSGLIAADDFIATNTLTSIEQVCFWGLYIISDIDAPDNDCGETRTADNFRVRVLGTTPAGLPDNLNVIKDTHATCDRGKLSNQNSLTVWDPPVETYGFQCTLDDAAVGLVPGTKYWLEIANNLAPTDECFFWQIQLSTESPQGNNFSAGGSDAAGYLLGAEREVDLAWCVQGAYEAPQPVVRPCCTCAGTCLSDELAACTDALAQFAIEANNNGAPLACDSEYQCPDVTPTNDECENALEVSVGTRPLSVLCATTDETLNPVITESGTDGLNFDVWYEFKAPQQCEMRVDMCPTGDAFDSMIAIYTNGTANCTCPTNPAATEPTFVVSSDEGCAAGVAAGGAGFTVNAAEEGQCFLIRIGNWAPGNTRGVGLVDISCGPAFCGNNAAEASNGEECDGFSDAACPGGCNPPGHAQECQCSETVVDCGDNVRQGAEQCDGTDSSACPGLCIPANQPNECTCQNVCGNGIKEGVEECDGPADDSCGGTANRCLVDCTCPAVACGNNFKDPGEECDGTDDANCDAECRGPNDPAGPCTCECGVSIVIPPALTAESPAIGKVRHISFVVPAGAPGDTALRVELTSLHHPSSPPAGTPNFAAFEGQFRYVNSFGGSTTCVDSATFLTNFRCGTLGCTPEYRNWASVLSSATNPASAAGLIHVTGDSVVPSSTLNVSHIDVSCGVIPAVADECAAASAPLAIPTTRWGDVAGSGGGPPDGIQNVIDIGSVVDNVKGIPSAIPERRAWMKNPPNTFGNPVNVIDIGLTVDSVKNFPYPYTIAVCP